MPTLAVHTPEGLILELEVAGAGSRFAAALVDMILFGTGLIAFAILIRLLSGFDPTGAGDFFLALLATGFLLALALTTALVHHARGGLSPGKALLGLQVVGADGERPALLAHLLRSLLGIVELLPVPISLGLLVIFFHPRRQRLGDLVAGTLVVRRGAEIAGEPWPGVLWTTLDRRRLPLTLGSVAGLDGADLAFLRRVVRRRTQISETKELASREQLLHAIARHYCSHLGIDPTLDARMALREIYLCLREALSGGGGRAPVE